MREVVKFSVVEQSMKEKIIIKQVGEKMAESMGEKMVEPVGENFIHFTTAPSIPFHLEQAQLFLKQA